jgi:hypothetical protein
LGNEPEQRLRVVSQQLMECGTPIDLSTKSIDVHSVAGIGAP